MIKRIIMSAACLVAALVVSAQAVESDWEDMSWSNGCEKMTPEVLNGQQVLMAASGPFDAGYGYAFDVRKKGNGRYSLRWLEKGELKPVTKPVSEVAKMIIENQSVNDGDDGDVWERMICNEKDLVVRKQNNKVVSIFESVGPLDVVDVIKQCVKIVLCNNKFASAAGKEFFFRWDGKCTFNGQEYSYEIQDKMGLPNLIVKLSNGKVYFLDVTVEGFAIYNGVVDSGTDGYEKGAFYMNVKADGTFSRWAVFTGEPFLEGFLGLNGMTKDVLAVIRNEIYAAHGYRFNTPAMKKYFEAKSWYSPSAVNNQVTLGDMEKLNVEVIKYYEAQQ